MAETDISDGVWIFYDAWAAFPSNRRDDEVGRIVGEFNVSLSPPDHGGTYGEFGIRFYDFYQGERWRPTEVHARLEAFGDSWAAIASNPELIAGLGQLDGKPQGPDEVRAMLLAIGMEDRTAVLRGNHPSTCPTCHGKGTLDDIGANP